MCANSCGVSSIVPSPSSKTFVVPLPPAHIFLAFLALGLTSFGGPVAHIGYFRDTFVARRGWLDERGYADLVALCQMLPGPTSSQVGIGIGLTKAGIAGAFAAWLGFTAPSAVVLADRMPRARRQPAPPQSALRTSVLAKSSPT